MRLTLPSSIAGLGLAMLLAGCGYIGEPLPPALHIPMKVTDLRAVQYGSNIVVDFTIPPTSTEGLALKSLGAVDLRVGRGPNPWDLNQWAAAATKYNVPATEPKKLQYSVPLAEWTGQEIVIAVRVANSRGRFSDWSNQVVVPVTPFVPSPADVKVFATPQGVSITWTPVPGTQFRMFKKTADQKTPLLLGTTPGENWLDEKVEFGKPYEYSLQAIRGKAESEIAGPFAITPADTFPPAKPSSVSVLAGVGSVELSWDRNTESDLKSYRVYRSVDGGAFERVIEVDTPAWSDKAVEPGKRYRYQVSAVDQSGNESEKSEPAEITLQ